MAAISKKEADAHDRIIEAAMALSDLLVSQGIEMEEHDLETLTFFLAEKGDRIMTILKKCTVRVDDVPEA
jgi:dsDNA-binding SOS-regulon protein